MARMVLSVLSVRIEGVDWWRGERSKPVSVGWAERLREMLEAERSRLLSRLPDMRSDLAGEGGHIGECGRAGGEEYDASLVSRGRTGAGSGVIGSAFAGTGAGAGAGSLGGDLFSSHVH